MSVYRRALAYYRPFLGQTILGLTLSLLVSGINLLKPFPFAFVIDEILKGGNSRTPPGPGAGFLVKLFYNVHASISTWLHQLTPVQGLFYLCLASVVITALSGALNVVKNVVLVGVSLKALLRLRTELYSYLQSLPLKFHDARRSSDSSFRVAYDSQSIQSFYNKSEFIFSAVIALFSNLAALWIMDWSIAVIALAVVPFVVASIYYYGHRVRSQSTTIAERESDVLMVIQEGLSSVKMVQAFGREAHEVAQLQRRAGESLTANLRLTMTTMNSSLIVSTLMAIGAAAVTFIAARHVLDKTLTIGDLTVLVAFLMALYQPIEALTNTIWGMEGAAAGAQRCFEVMDRANDVPDVENAKEITSTLGEIVFENVQFAYDERRPILMDINVRVDPGQTVAFVGGTGAGKSTVLSLVPRFYDPTGGRILLDGTDLKDIAKKSLRDQISIVLQDTLLFSTTIRENIAYGRPDATEEDIIQAAKQAQAHDFILTLTDGYKSLVGERGSHLSVGQRQRIGIARAFLKNAPILLLDEPTSALDTNTEAAIMVTIKELMKGRTTLIITHRIGTVHDMEKLVVLQQGRIVEVGTGAELLDRKGVYAALYQSANLGK